MRGLAPKYLIFLSILMSLSGVTLESLKQSYCEICEDHTVCIYGSDYNDPCENYKIPKEEFLKYHNDVRDQVARGDFQGRTSSKLKPAKDMVMMRWDPELATIARVLVKHCADPFEQDTCRAVKRDDRVVHPNQNIGKAPVKAGFEGIFQLWKDQSEHLTPEVVAKFPSVPESEEKRKELIIKILDIANVIWSEHDLLGCASAQASGELRVVCNYMSSFGDQGCTPGEPIYEMGDARSHCPEHFDKRNSTYQALCLYNGGKRIVANSYTFFMIFLGYKIAFYSLIH